MKNLTIATIIGGAGLAVLLTLLSPSAYASPKGIYHSDWAQISNMSIVKGEPTLFGQPAYLIGMIKNVGNDTQERLRLIVSLFDSNNNLIGVETGEPIFHILEPGDSTPYKIPVSTNISSLDHYLLQFDEDGQNNSNATGRTNEVNEFSEILTRPAIQNASALGSNAANITLVEFGDYQCNFCAQFHKQTRGEIISNYVNTGKLKFIFKDFIVNDSPTDKASTSAARASYCAADQGKFWQYHDELYENSKGENTGWVSKTSLESFAKNVNIPNLKKFSNCLSSQEHSEIVQENDELARSIGLKSTPTFILIREGEQPLGIVGNQPFDVFLQAISQLEKN